MSAGISARKSLSFMCPERPSAILSTPVTPFVRSNTDAKAQETPRSSFDYSPTPR